MRAAFKPFLHAHFHLSLLHLSYLMEEMRMKNWQQKITIGAMTKNDGPSKPDFLSLSWESRMD
jgi:hypothetical protein